MNDPNNEAKRHAVLAILAEVYGNGLARERPTMAQWVRDLDAIYAFHAKHRERRVANELSVDGTMVDRRVIQP